MSSAEYSCKLFKPIFAYRQIVWTLIRLLLEEQSDLGPHSLQKWLLKHKQTTIVVISVCSGELIHFQRIHNSLCPTCHGEQIFCRNANRKLQVAFIRKHAYIILTPLELGDLDSDTLHEKLFTLASSMSECRAQVGNTRPCPMSRINNFFNHLSYQGA